MKTYSVSFAAGIGHTPKHPERTARRNAGGDGSMNFDIIYREWPNRASMARSIRMQEQRERHSTDWYAVMPISPGEGY